MSGGAIAQAVGEIRLRDSQLGSDIARIRQRLLQAVQQVEREAIIDVGVRLDTTALRTQLAAFQAQPPISVPVRLDTDAAVSDLGALVAIGNESTINVDTDVNTTALDELQARIIALSAQDINLDVDVTGVAQATAEVQTLDAVASNTADENRGGMGRLARRLLLFGALVPTAIAGAGVAIGAFGVNAAAQFEVVQSSFENLLGSVEQGRSLLEEIRAFAVPAPFDAQLLSQTAANLLAIGVAADEVVPNLETLSGVVALLAQGNDEAFSRLTLALGQIRSAQRPLIQDLRQITQALPGFNTEMQLAAGVAEQFGISLVDAQEMIAAGGVSGAEAFDILLERMREFPGAATAVTAFAETTLGRLSAFRDTVRQSFDQSFLGVAEAISANLEPVGEAVERALAGVVPSLITSFDALIPRIAPLIDSLGTGLAPAFVGVFTGIGSAIEGLTPILEELLPVVGELSIVFGRLAAVAGPVAADVGSTIGRVLVPPLEALAEVLEVIPTEVLTVLVTGFLAFRTVQAVGPIINSLATGLNSLGRQTQTFMSGQTNLRGSLDSYFGALNKAADATDDTAARMTTSQRAIVTATAAIGGAFAGLALSSDDATQQLLGVAGSVSAVVAGFAAGGPIGAAVAGVGVVIGTLAGNMREAAREAEDLRSAAQGLAETLLSEFQALEGANPIRVLRDELDALKVVLDSREFVDFALDLLTPEQLALIQEAGLSVVQLRDAVRDVPDSVIGDIEDLATRLQDMLGRPIEVGTTVTLGPGFEDVEAGAEALRTELDGILDDLGAFGVALSSLSTQELLDILGALGLIENAADAASTATLEASRAQREQAISLLADLGTTAAQVEDAARRSGLGLEGIIRTLVTTQEEADLLASFFGIARVAMDDTAASATNYDASLQPVIASTREAAEVTDIWAAAQENLQGLLARSVGRFDQFVQQSEITRSIRDLRDLLTEPITVRSEQTAIDAEADRLAEVHRRIQDQLATIEDLRASVAQEVRFAEERRRDIEAAIAEAQGFGADRIVRQMQRALETVDQPLRDAQGRLEDAERRLGDIQADEVARLRRQTAETTTTMIDQIRQTAAEQGVSIFDLFLQGDPSTDDFNQKIAPVVSGVIADIDKLLGEGEFTQAGLLALDFMTQFGEELGTVVGPDFIEQFFNDMLDGGLEQFTNRVLGFDAPGIDVPVNADTSSVPGSVADMRRVVEAPLFVPVNVDSPDVESDILSRVTSPIPIPVELDVMGVRFPGGRGGGALLPIAQGGVINYFKDGGVRDFPHVAHVAPAGAWRVFAEPETWGEGYIPLAPWKRPRAKEVMRDIAQRFGMVLLDEPPSAQRIASSVAPSHAVIDSDVIARAVREGIEQARRSPDVLAREAQTMLNLEAGAIQVNESRSARKTAKATVRELILTAWARS